MKRMRFPMVLGLALLFCREATVAQQSLRLSVGSKQISVVPVFSGDQDYVSVSVIAELLAVNTYWNAEKQKLVLYLPGHQIKVTAANPFVVVDEKTVHQMPVATSYIDGVVFAPIQFFIPILNAYATGPVLVDGKKLTLDGGVSSVATRIDVPKKDGEEGAGGNLLDAAAEKKSNGLLIRLKTSRAFSKQDLEIWKNRSWIYVTVSNGVAGKGLSESLQDIEAYKLIKRALVIQNKRSVQFSFQLSKDIAGHEVLTGDPEPSILVLLRVKDPADLELGSAGTAKGVDLAKQKDQWKIDKIVLDAGHGGKDGGAKGKNGTKEKDITLAVVQKLGKLIEQRLGIPVEYTRSTDVFISLNGRTKFANGRNAKLFVSVHCNSSRNRKAGGFETFFLSPSRTEEALAVARLENEVIALEDEKHDYGDFTDEKFILAHIMQSVFVKESEELADRVQRGLDTKLTIKNRGVSQAPFYVLMGASMPCILVETAFISNPTEEKFLKSDDGQNKLAEGILSGIREFIKAYEKVGLR